MDQHNITVYGADWCPDCRRSKKFLDSKNIPYNWVDIEQDKEGEALVLRKNNGKRIIPTIVFPDGFFVTEPSDEELGHLLGVHSHA